MWREELVRTIEQLEHPSWGPSHCRRVYSLSADLARQEGLEVDDDVLFAVAWTHDVGTFPDYALEGLPAPECAARGAAELLPALGFPAEKLDAVTDIIRSHDFERPPIPRAEARVFHDADMLDFMGAIGVTRLLSIVGLEEWTPDTRSAIEQAASFAEELPGKMVLGASSHIAHHRKAEMQEYICALGEQTEQMRSL